MSETVKKIPHFVVTRSPQNGIATYGVLQEAGGSFTCVTLERPYVDANHDGLSDPNVSCIPAGTYRFKRRLSPKRGYDVFEGVGIPGRSEIQIHKGVYVAHSLGCILLGSAFYTYNTGRGLTGSGNAFDRFMLHLEGIDEIDVTFLDPPPTA